jgi:hypothetical protein
MGADQHPLAWEVAVSWLTFVLIAGGIVAAGFAAAALLLGSTDRGALRIAAGAVLALAAVAVAFPVAKTSVRNINGVRLDNRGTPPNQAKAKCIVDSGAADIVPLIERLRADLPATAQYQVIGPTRTDTACLTTNMLPHVSVQTAGSSDWLVFTDGVPPGDRARLLPGSLRQVTDKLAFGRLR